MLLALHARPADNKNIFHGLWASRDKVRDAQWRLPLCVVQSVPLVGLVWVHCLENWEGQCEFLLRIPDSLPYKKQKSKLSPEPLTISTGHFTPTKPHCHRLDYSDSSKL